MILNVGFNALTNLGKSFMNLNYILADLESKNFWTKFGNSGHCDPTQKASLPFAVGKKKVAFRKKVIKQILGLI